MLTADQILKANDLPIVTVTVPEWNNGEVGIRAINGEERERFEDRFLKWHQGKHNKSNDVRASLIALCACDENGTLLFTEKQIAELNKKNGAALDRLFEVALKLNRFSKADMEELEKN